MNVPRSLTTQNYESKSEPDYRRRISENAAMKKKPIYIVEFNTKGTISYLSNCVGYSARTVETRFARQFKFKSAAQTALNILDHEDPFREWVGKVIELAD